MTRSSPSASTSPSRASSETSKASRLTSIEKELKEIIQLQKLRLQATENEIAEKHLSHEGYRSTATDIDNKNGSALQQYNKLQERHEKFAKCKNVCSHEQEEEELLEIEEQNPESTTEKENKKESNIASSHLYSSSYSYYTPHSYSSSRSEYEQESSSSSSSALSMSSANIDICNDLHLLEENNKNKVAGRSDLKNKEKKMLNVVNTVNLREPQTLLVKEIEMLATHDNNIFNKLSRSSSNNRKAQEVSHQHKEQEQEQQQQESNEQIVNQRIKRKHITTFAPLPSLNCMSTNKLITSIDIMWQSRTEKMRRKLKIDECKTNHKKLKESRCYSEQKKEQDVTANNKIEKKKTLPPQFKTETKLSHWPDFSEINNVAAVTLNKPLMAANINIFNHHNISNSDNNIHKKVNTLLYYNNNSNRGSRSKNGELYYYYDKGFRILQYV